MYAFFVFFFRKYVSQKRPERPYPITPEEPDENDVAITIVHTVGQFFNFLGNLFNFLDNQQNTNDHDS